MENIVLQPDKMPQHIAIIMDGNGRWAQQRGMDRVMGHREGVETVRRIVEECGKLHIPYLTLYAFSTENWNRPQYEVEALMRLMSAAIRSEVPKLMENHVRLNAIGHLEDLPQVCQDELAEACQLTAKNDGLTLTLSLSYSGRSELKYCMRALAQQVANGQLKPQDIEEQTITKHLYTAGMPEPDILIRTGGEQRISNFLLWQIAYAELFFTPVMWPDFSGQHLREIISQFQNRERRFGKTGEQVRNEAQK
jgi:undecaprenyl diphosphate synthase